MARRRKMKKSRSEVKERNIDLQRFAYDVFTYSALKFDVHQNCICKWEGEENDYGSSDFILVLSRIFLHYQISGRSMWYRLFKSRHSSRKIQSFEDVSQILQQVLNLCIKEAGKDVFQKVVFSLSVINEVIIFLHSENCSLYVKELPCFWLEYFTPMTEEFEDKGGLAELYKTYNGPKYDSVDNFYHYFITEFCLPYENSTKPKLFDEYLLHSGEYFTDVMANLPESEGVEYMKVINATVWHENSDNSKPPPKKAMVKLKISEFDPLQNPGLGIPQHEELLRYAGISVPADATSPQNLPGGSGQEPLRRRRGSSSEKKRIRQRREIDSWSRLVKDCEKLNLDSSHSEHSTQKEK